MSELIRRLAPWILSVQPNRNQLSCTVNLFSKNSFLRCCTLCCTTIDSAHCSKSSHCLQHLQQLLLQKESEKVGFSSVVSQQEHFWLFFGIILEIVKDPFFETWSILSSTSLVRYQWFVLCYVVRCTTCVNMWKLIWILPQLSCKSFFIYWWNFLHVEHNYDYMISGVVCELQDCFSVIIFHNILSTILQSLLQLNKLF